jgi:hypothetical protein
MLGPLVGPEVLVTTVETLPVEVHLLKKVWLELIVSEWLRLAVAWVSAIIVIRPETMHVEEGLLLGESRAGSSAAD